MRIWNLFYCTSEIVNESPVEFLDQLRKSSKHEVAIITRRLNDICELERPNWPHNWFEPPIAKNNIQLTTGNHRVYLGTYGSEIVVFYICRKKGRKAKPFDLNRAVINQEAYEAWKRGEK